jgi:AraC-like DNA-binding protein
MRENACHGIGIQEILQQVPMSRTAFERKFRRQFGHAPYEEIVRIRCQRARELLSTTRLAVAEVAERAGFSSGETLCAAFRKRGWPSPRTFRAMCKD